MTDADAPGTGPGRTTRSAAEELDQDARVSLELAVLDTLGDGHSHGAHYDSAPRRIVVTVYNGDDPDLSGSELAVLVERAGAVTNGVPVEIEVTDETPPEAQ
ncbi:hypothetical protein [Nocardioides sp. 1609]|uniref:hypothetical protein n=1 Tax=Nocardioides sp. 1609 TaxID=2508327 RepID=UPI00106FA031|nr:hypothetical protein [Nocardioides sp. 1609]